MKLGDTDPGCGICRFYFPEGSKANILIDACAVHQFHPNAQLFERNTG